MNFILAMILCPHVQEKAHSLIESVVGTGRLPTFQDRPSLPYVDAILRECLRWHPVLPLCALLTQQKRDKSLIDYSGHACCCRQRRLQRLLHTQRHASSSSTRVHVDL